MRIAFRTSISLLLFDPHTGFFKLAENLIVSEMVKMDRVIE
jgi:hypothetical protein